MRHKTELILLAALTGACTQVELTPPVWDLLRHTLTVSTVALTVLAAFALLVRMGVWILIWHDRRKHPEDYRKEQ